MIKFKNYFIMKLISMTGFVFMLRNRTTSELCKDFPKAFKMPEWNGDKNEMVKKMLAIDAIQWRLTGEYAKFLKKPLQLGMFVPCDDSEQAKEKVLFEGCSTIQQGENTIVIFNDSAIWLTWTNRIIEDLIKDRVILTENALKQIGL